MLRALRIPLFVVLIHYAANPVLAQRVGGVSFDARSFQVGPGAAFATAADVDGDGRLDLLVALQEPDEMAVLLGDGRGGFRPLRPVPAGDDPVGLAVADFDRDGHADVLVANHETDYLTLLQGDGRGGFREAPASPLRIDVRPHPHAVLARDLDRDGHVDLVVDDRDRGALRVIPGLDAWRFDTRGHPVEMGGNPYRGMALGDVDGDGQPDFVTPNPDEVAVARATEPQRFIWRRHRAVAADSPFAVALADLDGDGRMDLVSAAGQDSDAVQVFRGDGTGGFREHPQSPFQFETGAKSVVTGDFNGDGRADAAVASYTAGEVLVLVLVGGASRIETGRLPGGTHPWGLAAADFDGDGRDDLVVTDQGGDTATVFMGGGR